MYNASRISFTVKEEIYIYALTYFVRIWEELRRNGYWFLTSCELEAIDRGNERQLAPSLIQAKKAPNSLGEGNTLHREVVWVNVSRWLLLTTEIISGNYEFRLHCFINYILNLTAHAKLSDTWGCDTHKLICQDM